MIAWAHLTCSTTGETVGHGCVYVRSLEGAGSQQNFMANATHGLVIESHTLIMEDARSLPGCHLCLVQSAGA